MDRYSFLVRLLPPLLHAGLARRTNIAIALIEAEKGEWKAQTCAMRTEFLCSGNGRDGLFRICMVFEWTTGHRLAQDHRSYRISVPED